MFKEKMLTDDERWMTDDDGQRPVTIAHLEHFLLRWAKNDRSAAAYYGGAGCAPWIR